MPSALALTGCVVDLERGVVLAQGRAAARLTTRECAVLRYLAERSPRAVPREEILSRVLGYAETALSRACDVVVRRVRTKIEVDPSAPAHLLTDHGNGYQLVLTPPSTSVAADLAPAPSAPALVLGATRVDLASLRVDGPRGATRLTPNEGALLQCLADARGAVVDRQALARRVWGPQLRYGRRLDNTVLRLRAKIEPDPGDPRFLRTVVGSGYQLDLAPPPSRFPGECPERFPPLPARLDRRFGPDTQVRAVAAMLGPDRLVTLVGPGGIGKTGLALAVAAGLRAAGREVGWVEAVHATTADALWTEVALLTGTERATVEQLGVALRARGPTVLVLDNLEQLRGAAAAIVDLLGRAPELAVLATSRVALRTRGERVVHVDPLPPADGVALFVDRALRPPDPDDLADVDALVRDLDGVPLAIELAAARTAVLTAADQRARAAQHLRMLVSRDELRAERHRSLEGSLDASFDLLTPAARRALTHLSVMAGPFSVDAAEAVVDLGPSAPLVIDVLEELVDWSLVRIDAGRASLPELVRQYAAARLTDERDGAELRHGRFFARDPGDVEGPDEPEIFARLSRELPNHVAALDRAVARGDGAVALGALAAAAVVWHRAGPAAAGIEAADRALACALDPGETATARRFAASFRAVAGDLDGAVAHLDTARATATEPEERRQIAAAAASVGYRQGRLADYTRAVEEAHALLSSATRPTVRCRTLLALAGARVEQLDLDAAAGLVAEAERIAALHAGPTLRAAVARRRRSIVQLGGPGGASSPSEAAVETPHQLHHQALGHLWAGRGAEAVAAGLAACAGFERIGSRSLHAVSLTYVGWAWLDLGQLDLAQRALEEAVAGATAPDDGLHHARALQGLAMAQFERVQLERAEELLRASVAEIGDPPLAAYGRALLARTLDCRGRREEAVAELEAVRHLPRARTIAALYLGDVLADQGQLDEARRLLEHARTTPTPAPALLVGHVASSLAGVLARLGRPDDADALLAPADRPSTRTPSYVARRALAAAEIAAARGDLAGIERALDLAVAAWGGPLGARFGELRALCSDAAEPSRPQVVLPGRVA